jgi:hypothetical protein
MLVWQLVSGDPFYAALTGALFGLGRTGGWLWGTANLSKVFRVTGPSTQSTATFARSMNGRAALLHVLNSMVLAIFGSAVLFSIIRVL